MHLKKIIFTILVFVSLQSVAENLIINNRGTADNSTKTTLGNNEYRSTFYNIAHMANTTQLVDYSVEAGANGVEADLKFDLTTPKKFH